MLLIILRPCWTNLNVLCTHTFLGPGVNGVNILHKRRDLSKYLCHSQRMWTNCEVNLKLLHRCKTKHLCAYLGSHAAPEVRIRGSGLQHGCYNSHVLLHQLPQHILIGEQVVTVSHLQTAEKGAILTTQHITHKRAHASAHEMSPVAAEWLIGPQRHGFGQSTVSIVKRFIPQPVWQICICWSLLCILVCLQQFHVQRTTVFQSKCLMCFTKIIQWRRLLINPIFLQPYFSTWISYCKFKAENILYSHLKLYLLNLSKIHQNLYVGSRENWKICLR